MTTNSPIGGFQGRVPLISALAVVVVLIAQSIVIGIAGFIFFSATGVQNSGEVLLGILDGLVQSVPFAVGVFVALRYFASLVGSDGWAKVAVRAVIAAALGGAAVFVVAAVISAFSSVVLDGDILGYSFPGATVNTSNIVYGFAQALGAGVTTLVEWLPIVVVVCACQKLWLAAHTVSVATASVSDAGKL